MKTWKNLLTPTDKTEGFEVFALPENWVNFKIKMKNLLKKIEFPEMLDMSVLSDERGIYYVSSVTIDQVIKKLEEIRCTEGILAVRFRLSAETVIFAIVEEISEH